MNITLSFVLRFLDSLQVLSMVEMWTTLSGKTLFCPQIFIPYSNVIALLKEISTVSFELLNSTGLSWPDTCIVPFFGI
jgi:hypothetical protein